jgi:HPt (histidine-containing phosphotransfer) domain-containing protein
MNSGFEISVAAKKKYFSRRKTDLLSCNEALVQSNFSFLQNIGHQLSGNGISFGFDKLSVIGAALEIAGQEKNYEKCKDLVDQFSKILDEIAQNPIFSDEANA